MHRRTFLKAVGGLSAAIALPVGAIEQVLPKAWRVSPVRWTRRYDLYRDAWPFRADCFVGKAVDVTPTHITMTNPEQFSVDLISPTEELSDQDKSGALGVLMKAARDKARRMNG